jgi:hypothetical protein
LNGTTTCDPESPGFESFSFPTPQRWEDFKPEDEDYHDYTIDVRAGVGGAEYEEALTQELIRHPTPGYGSASPHGTVIDVNIPGPFGRDDVKSYTRIESDGSKFVVNVTQENHTLHSGFIVRKVVPDGQGGYMVRTYGEGNSWKQSGIAGAIADPFQRETWRLNARTIIEHARQAGR